MAEWDHENGSPVNDGHPRLAEILAWLVMIAALVLSFTGSVQLAETPAHKFPWPEPLIWAGTGDVGAAACMLLIRNRAQRGVSTREVWALTVVCWLVAIAAQVTFGWPDPVAIGMHVWAPVLAVWLWHALISDGRPEHRMRSAEHPSEHASTHDEHPRLGEMPTEHHPGEVGTQRRTQESTRAEPQLPAQGVTVQHVLDVIATRGKTPEQVTARWLGEQLGLSRASGQRWLARARAARRQRAAA